MWSNLPRADAKGSCVPPHVPPSAVRHCAALGSPGAAAALMDPAGRRRFTRNRTGVRSEFQGSWPGHPPALCSRRPGSACSPGTVHLFKLEHNAGMFRVRFEELQQVRICHAPHPYGTDHPQVDSSRPAARGSQWVSWVGTLSHLTSSFTGGSAGHTSHCFADDITL